MILIIYIYIERERARKRGEGEDLYLLPNLYLVLIYNSGKKGLKMVESIYT
jgi:hypothetical protein